MQNLEELLSVSLIKLGVLKTKKQEELDKLKAEKERYSESNKEVFEEAELDEVDDYEDTEEIDISMPRENWGYLSEIQNLQHDINRQIAACELGIDFSDGKTRVEAIVGLLRTLERFDPEDLVNRINAATETCEKKCTITPDEIKKINLKIDAITEKITNAAKSGVFYENKTPRYESIRSRKDLFRNPNKTVILRELKDVMKAILPTYNKLGNYLEYADKELDKTPDLNDILFKDDKLEKRREEINERLAEFDKKIKFIEKDLEDINKTYETYNEYKQTHAEEKLNNLLSKFIGFKFITQRNVKKLTYEKEEKTVATPAPVVQKEEPAPAQIEQVVDPGFFPEEESDYFKWNTTETIICFLGPDDDTILNDLDREFDKSAKPIVFDKLTNIFDQLRNESENKQDQGSNPHQGTTRKVLALLESPYHFNYKRYGTGRDPYRIHAIERHSDLLKQLGFGKGNIIFFGAAGLNITENKADSYNRLGKRAVHELDIPVKLRSNFNYIEHITRGYIPIELLSDEDKRKYDLGRFNSRMKGGKLKAIEGNKFIHYEALDEKTMVNVHNWLFDYFIKQTNMMVDIYIQNKELKGNSLD